MVHSILNEVGMPVLGHAVGVFASVVASSHASPFVTVQDGGNNFDKG